MPGLTRELGIDLGTMNTVITEGNQILLQEPTVVALIVQEQKMVEWGQSARDMLARFAELEKSPEHIHSYRITPLSLWNAAAAGYSSRTAAGSRPIPRPW